MLLKIAPDVCKAMVKAAGKHTALHARYIAVLHSRAMQRYGSKKAVKPS